MVITGFLKERKSKKKELERIAERGDYRLLTDMLKEEIKKGRYKNYDFVNYRVLQFNMPKQYFREILRFVEEQRPNLYLRPIYGSLKTALQMRLQEGNGKSEKTI